RADLVGDLLAARAAGLARLAGQLVEALALQVHHLAQALGDLLVDAPEVVLLQALLALLAEPLHEVPQPHDVVALAVAEALLHEAAQRRVEVTVVEQVVGDLLEDGVGVEVEADLRAVPPGVSEPRRADHLPTVPSRRRVRPVPTHPGRDRVGWTDDEGRDLERRGLPVVLRGHAALRAGGRGDRGRRGGRLPALRARPLRAPRRRRPAARRVPGREVRQPR